MTDETPKKKSLAGLGQMLEKAATTEKATSGKAAWASAEDPEPAPAAKETLSKAKPATKAKAKAADPVEQRGYEITFRKKSST